ncbi:MAG: GGDEF domain-containing protein [Acidobacteria bacterium]|nr:GGDEF domain-containing protein [Acidobacteriota bacterium]
MISILRTNDEAQLRQELKRKDELAMEAIGAYATAVEAICEHMLRVCPPLIDRHSPEFRSIAEEVQPDMTVAEVEKSRRRLQARVAKFGADASAEYESLAKDIREILRLATSATESLQNQSDGSGEEWNRFTSEMERIAAMGDLQEVRVHLRREVQHMNECMHAMARDNAMVIGQLHSELVTLRKRAASAEEKALEDPLTGLRNRQGIEVALQERIESAQPFCILLFDIKRFKAVNDRHGFEAGDELLRQLAKRLASAIREGDLAGRWKNDRFLVLVDCPMHIVIPRARQIHGKLNGRYELGDKNAGPSVEVITYTGLAEFRVGDGAQQLLDRADKLLLAAKA